MSAVPAKWILYPVLAMVLVTMIVGFVLYRRRFAEMRTRRIHPQAVAGAAKMSGLLEDTGPADNFRNLFEMPVLFYAAAIVIYVAALANVWYVVLAWAYVVARATHSAIHCSYNKVVHRFMAFFVSFVLLFLLWASIGWDLLVAGRS